MYIKPEKLIHHRSFKSRKILNLGNLGKIFFAFCVIKYLIIIIQGIYVFCWM